jgi:UDP-glucose 4-epimerase
MKIGLTGYRGQEGDPGFIGTWLDEELIEHGHQTKPVWGDVRFHWTLDAVASCDLVVHLAARVGRLRCEESPRDVIDTNAWGTFNVARACAAAGVKLLYVSSSEAAYAGNLYGLSKRWGEDAARIAFADHPERLQVARLFMPYGPGVPPGHGRAALTNWLWGAMTRTPLIVHARTSRSWCWVGDTARALRLIIEADREPFYDVWNVGRVDNHLSSLRVAQLCVERYAERDYSLIRQIAKPAGVVDHKLPDVAPLYGLGWRPLVDLPEGLGLVADWLREWGAPVGAATEAAR